MGIESTTSPRAAAAVDAAPSIAIIVPTIASAERRPYLMRAVQSVLEQDVPARVVVVANGAECDEGVLLELAQMREVSLLRIDEASMPLALAVGRLNIATAYFGELDDDDILLPGALRTLQGAMEQNPEADGVVANCILRGAEDTLNMPDADWVRRDPLAALMRQPWLHPGAVLLRAESVPASTLARLPKYLEWTYLASFLCLNHRLCFLSEPVSVHHRDLPHSVHNSRAAMLGRRGAFAHLLALPLPARIRRFLRRKQGANLHGCAFEYLARGDMTQAWLCHARSLLCPGGWRYLSSTRHLLRLPVR